jgi:hypothetical protein
MLMKSFRTGLSLLAFVALMLAFTSQAHAQATRTWVSGVGDDANPCSRTAPCKTFAGAISKTAPAGEIDCLDPGGFGALTITKSITIDCDSGAGGVLVSGTPGITISANAASDVIILRNLQINGLNTGTNGINILSALAVHLEDVWIQEFATTGINVNTSAPTQLTTIDVNISECPTGIQINSTVNPALADIEDTRIYNSTNGIVAQNGSRVVVRNSVIEQATLGISQNTATVSGSTVNVVNSTLFHTTTALQSSASASMVASGNTFVNDATVFNLNGGQIFTGNDNISSGSGTGSTTGASPKI